MGDHCRPHLFTKKRGFSHPRAVLRPLGPHKAARYKGHLSQAGGVVILMRQSRAPATPVAGAQCGLWL